VATSSKGGASPVDAVAFVAGKPISQSSYGHWRAVERALGEASDAGHRALGFLITSMWLEDEASVRGTSVSQTATKQRLADLERQSFPKPGALKAYLARAHESEADLLGRVRIEMLRARIAADVAAGKSASQRAAVLASFQQGFQQRWRRRTTCRPAYVMGDCSEYRGRPESQEATSSTATSSASSTPTTSSGAASSSSSTNTKAVVQPGIKGMTITGSAFAPNGAIPQQYTCDGEDVSPPLQWRNIPADAGALVLIVIDDNSTGMGSGIRWMVGDISPSSKGVAEDATPEGSIEGADTQGHTGYGGICPAPGKTSTIEFVLYALRRKIPLSAGFMPAIAEGEYGEGKDLLGSAAVAYAVYHRP
jgi:hypothetical protein